jgi:type VI secretion system secreted protein Hcp
MAFDAFLKIDGIKGESAHHLHKDEIEINSFSWGVSNSGNRHGGTSGGATGHPQAGELHFTTVTQRSTPLLFEAIVKGEIKSTAQLTLQRAGSEAGDFYKWTLSGVLVTSLHTAGASTSGDDRPIEQLSLSFDKVAVSYREQRSDGSLGEWVTRGYDLAQQKAF